MEVNKSLPFGVKPEIHSQPSPDQIPAMVPDKDSTEAAQKSVVVSDREIPNYMALPGTAQPGFNVFFQFDEDEPVIIAETRNKFIIELTGTEQPKVGVGQFTSSAVTFTAKGNIGGPAVKNFKIFLTPKK